jgi:hypothetical protein
MITMNPVSFWLKALRGYSDSFATALLALALVVAPACGDDDDDDDDDNNTGGDTGGSQTTAGETTTTDTAGPTDTTETTGTGGISDDTGAGDDTDTTASSDTADTSDTGDTDDTDAPAPGSCDVVVPENCLLPFPSNFFTKADAGSPTGRLLNFSPDAFPPNSKGARAYSPDFNTYDGFSPAPQILTYIADISLTGLATQGNDGRSIEADSPTLIIDAETGEKQPHWVELDQQVLGRKDDPSVQMLYIRPSKKLAWGRRYIVALRNLKNSKGATVESSAAFTAIRDKTPTNEPGIEARRPAIDAVLNTLDGFGIARESVNLAWDFTTMSEGRATKRLIKMADEMIDLMPAAGPAYSYKLEDVDIRDPSKDSQTYMVMRGTFDVPLFLSSETRGDRLALGEDGLPTALDDKGVPRTAKVEFWVQVPQSARTTPAKLVHLGHGLLQSADQVTLGSRRGFSARNNAILFATDWWGLASDDLGFLATELLQNIDNFPAIVERIMQGIVNQIALDYVMQGAFADDPLMNPDNKPLYDKSKVYYWGHSLGGINGIPYVALSPKVERAIIGAAGFPFPLLLERSVAFKPFLAIFDTSYPKKMDQLIGLQVLGLPWTEAEPTGFVDHLIESPFDGRPQRRVFSYMTKNDDLVTNLSSESYFRTIGLKQVEPVNRTTWGLDSIAGPVEGSAFFDFDTQRNDPPVPSGNTGAGAQNGAHDYPSVDELLQKMQADFLYTGTITNLCDGICDPN